MSYLIDSVWLLDTVAGNRLALETIAELTSNAPSISTISIAEVCDGAHGTPHPFQTLVKIRESLGSFAVLPVTSSLAERFARCSAIDDTDLLIAATALGHDLTLVTCNQRHFARIPG